MTALAVLASIGFTAAAHAQYVPGRGTWEATMQARDVNGDGTTDAFYDTVLDITWLSRDLGTMSFADALARVATLDIYGVTGWRLPQMIDTGAPGCNAGVPSGTATDCGSNMLLISADGATVYSELAHWLRVTQAVEGLFVNASAPAPVFGQRPVIFVNSVQVWESATSPPPIGDMPWYVSISEQTLWWSSGGWTTRDVSLAQRTGSFTEIGTVFAVREGDIAAAIPQVPEPSTYALMALGLLATGAAAMHRRMRSHLGG